MNQTEKNSLQDVFSISGVAGDTVGRPKDQAVMDPKCSIKLVRDGDCRFLCQYASQVTTSRYCLHH
jgi:hypothetical protein